MTGDGQLVELLGSAQYHLDGRSESLRRHAVRTSDPDVALRPIVESSIRSVVGRRTMEGLLAGRRREAERATLLEIQRRADVCGLGLVIDAVAYGDVRPPLLVADAYHDVSRAESDRARRINEGSTYRLEQVKAAEGRAAVARDGAEADRLTRSTRASGEADVFVALVLARAAFPALTDHRLYWEALASVLANKPKLILDPDKARRRHLILPDFPLGGDSATLKAAVIPLRSL